MEKKEKKEFTFVYTPSKRKELSDKNARRGVLDFVSVKLGGDDFAEELMDCIACADGYDGEDRTMFNCEIEVAITVYSETDDHDPRILFRLPECVYDALARTKVIRNATHTVIAGYSLRQVPWREHGEERIEVRVSRAGGE